MIQRTQRLLLPLVCVAALLGGMFAQLAVSAEPAFVLDTPTVAVTSNHAPSVSGQSVTLTTTVTGTGVTPTGTVDFVDGITPLCSSVALASTVTNVATATCTPSSLSVATHSITGEYSGDGVYDPTVSSAFSQVVGQASTTTALVSGTNPSAAGASVTYTATVAAVVPGTGSPTGTVAFKDNGTDITGCATQAITTGVATCSTAVLGIGSHPVTAVYSGDASFTTSTSNTVTQVVAAIVTTTTVVSGTNPSVWSGPVTFTATVASGSGTPTGNVAFKRSGVDVTGCATQALTSGVATCTTSALLVGSNSITAVYAGAGNFAGSTSSAVSQVVSKAGTTGVVVSNDLTATWNQPITFTATISPTSPATATPAIGTVSFNADGFAIEGCEAKALTGGVATCTANADPVGVASITAVFSGDVNFTTSTSPAITETTSKAASVTGLASSDSTARSGQEVTFTATITSPAGTPDGTVSFFRVRQDTTREALGTKTLASGVATLVTGSLPVESGMDIVAEYNGTAHYNASTLTITQTVQRSLTKTLITSSRKNSKVGDPVTYKVTVSSDGEGEGMPTGLVAIYRERPSGNLQWIGRGNLRSGVTNIVVTDLPVGSYKIEAQYRGTDTHRPSVRTMTQTVTG